MIVHDPVGRKARALATPFSLSLSLSLSFFAFFPGSNPKIASKHPAKRLINPVQQASLRALHSASPSGAWLVVYLRRNNNVHVHMLACTLMERRVFEESAGPIFCVPYCTFLDLLDAN